MELGGEGVRKYDLIRWNLIKTAFDETKVNLGKFATAAALSPYTYMLQPPAYSMTGTLPTAMLFKTGSQADDVTLWANSFYKPAPAGTPAGTTRLAWATNTVNTANLARFATGFTQNRSELFPIPQPARDANFNLSQNPNY